MKKKKKIGIFFKKKYSRGILMKCCQFKQLHPIWDGRLVSMKMGKKRKKENNDSRKKRRSMAD